MRHSSLAAAVAALMTLVSALHPRMRLQNRNDVAITTTQLDDFEFYSQYAGAAYCNSGTAVGDAVTCTYDVCDDVEAAGATVVASFVGSDTDVQVYVATDPTNELVVVSYMGTHGIADFLVDAEIILVLVNDLVPGGLVHSGFLSQFKEANDTVQTAVASAMADNPDYSLIVTGHSLGAAVATISAAYLREAGFPCDLYAYGSPRVGDATFADFVTKQAGGEYRATHVDDPVPRLPPILLDYRHTSPEYWFHTGNDTTVDYTVADAKICYGDANIFCNAGQLGFDVDAHYYYFGYIVGCGSGNEPTSRRARAVDDPAWPGLTEHEAEIEAWAVKDIAYVKAGNATE